MKSNSKPKQLHLFNQPQLPPEPKANMVAIPAQWHPRKVFAYFTYLGHGENAKETARAIKAHCVRMEYEALIDHDFDIGWVFHTLISPNWNVFRKPLAEHFPGFECYIKRQIAAKLRSQGYDPKLEVRCSAGRADIVTDEAVFEVKQLLTREALFSAIGQVLRYRESIDTTKRAVVIGQEARGENIDDLIAYAQSVGVEIAFWQRETL